MIASWAFLLLIILIAPRTFGNNCASYSQIVVMMMAVLLPDALGTWRVFRRVRTDSRNDARRAATAFAVSAPMALGVGYLLGELVGGYAEVVLGRYFILPAVVTVIILLVILIPSGVVMWALHPSSCVGPVTESQTK
jgi:hypothetical protein